MTVTNVAIATRRAVFYIVRNMERWIRIRRSVNAMLLEVMTILAAKSIKD